MTAPGMILRKVHQITPLSESAMRLMEIVSDPDHGLDQIIRVVETDSVLTGQVLHVVNSVAFGLRSEIATVARAIPYMGDKMVVGLSLGMCAASLFNDPLEGYESEAGDLWKHSLRSAIASREAARFTDGRASPDLAYTAGILHDIGKSIISRYLEKRKGEIVRTVDAMEEKDYLLAERLLLGTDHQEVGGALAEHWQLPEPLRMSVTHHHSPANAPEEFRALVYAVHLGDFIAMKGGTGTGADTMMYLMDEHYKDYIAISDEEIESLVYQTGDEFATTVAAMFPDKQSGS